MNENEIAKMLRDNLKLLPFNVNDIPAWVIDKACGKNAGFCIVSMKDGYIGIEHETDKAYLLYVENTFNTRILVVRIKFVCKEHKEPYSPDTHAMLKLAAAEEMYPDYDVDEDGNVYRC